MAFCSLIPPHKIPSGVMLSHPPQPKSKIAPSSSSSPSSQVYATVGAPVLDSVLQGCHGCVLAYGQTCSGKTHSLLNLGEDGGGGEVGTDG